MRKILVLCLLLVAASAAADDYEIWNGFSFTPGAGLRHLGLDITRKSDGFTGNIAQDVPAKVFFTFNIESPKYRFDNSNWGVSIVNYNSFVTVDHQWYDYTGGSSSTDGERIDVGTEISGRYSYLLPQVFYETGRPGHRSFKFALGFGIWNANMSGTIKLTPGNQPTVLTPSSDISINTSKLGYLMTMSYRTETNWIWEMSLGGIDFGDAEYDYKVEEVTITIGKTFML
jgi:hypothetical protein